MIFCKGQLESMADVCRPLSPVAERLILEQYAEIGYTGVKPSENKSVGHIGGRRQRRGTRRRQKKQRKQYGGGYESWFTDGLSDDLIAGADTIRELGRGTYGVVSLLEVADGRKIVEKCIQVDDVPGNDSCNLLRLVRNEAAILKKLSENPAVLPYIIPCIGYKLPGAAVGVGAGSAANYPSEKYAYLYFPYIVGEDAINYFNNLYNESYAQRRILLSQVVYDNLFNHVFAGLNAIHAAGFIHRDIKLENIYVDTHDPENIRFLIIDFGLAIEYIKGKLSTVGGTRGYLHPDLEAALRVGSAVYKPEYDLHALKVCIQKIFDLFDNLSKWLDSHAAAAAAAAAAAVPPAAPAVVPAAAAPPAAVPPAAPKKKHSTIRRRPKALAVERYTKANYTKKNKYDPFAKEIVNAYFKAQEEKRKM